MFRVLDFGFWILNYCGFRRSSPELGSKAHVPLSDREPEKPDADVDALLRIGLAALPVPQTSPDFAARIQAEFGAGRRAGQSHHSPPLGSARHRLWAELRPMMMGAACSLCLTLAVARWAILMPTPVASPASPALPVQAVTADALLDRLERQHARRTNLGMNLPPRTQGSTGEKSGLSVRPSKSAI